NFLYLRVMKRSQIKQHIIETASALFYKQGYNLTGINEIIAESGIAKATLYNHFKSKEDICIAYLAYRNTSFLEEIGAYCRKQSLGEAQLLAIFDFLQLFFLDRDFNGCWCIRTAAEIPKDNERVKTEIKQQKEAFIRLIEALVAENSQTPQPLLAKQIYLLYEGAVAESHLHQADWPIAEAKKICERIL
ncbi:MAG: TetR/AcrR family transcriptional regulator, partial [Bacteroidota bacterium]